MTASTRDPAVRAWRPTQPHKHKAPCPSHRTSMSLDSLDCGSFSGEFQTRCWQACRRESGRGANWDAYEAGARGGRAATPGQETRVWGAAHMGLVFARRRTRVPLSSCGQASPRASGGSAGTSVPPERIGPGEPAPDTTRVKTPPAQGWRSLPSAPLLPIQRRIRSGLFSPRARAGRSCQQMMTARSRAQRANVSHTLTSVHNVCVQKGNPGLHLTPGMFS